MPEDPWNEHILAGRGPTEIVEGNHSLAAVAVKRELFHVSACHTACGWKGARVED